ncbi:MAG: Ig-like domain-containing protein [Eubacterium sp.]|nr:Ig-like domain-containing protein [Eubacterium sp.]
MKTGNYAKLHKRRYCVLALVLLMVSLCMPMPALAASGVTATNQLTVVVGSGKQIEVSGGQFDSLTFSSTKKSIAIVDENGTVTGKKIGSCQIKITVSSAGENTTIRTKVTVVKKQGFSAAKVYKKMMAMQDQYPEGKHWTNDNSYIWHGFPNVEYHAFGCAAFASIISDAAFGKNTVARQINNPSFAKVRVGDILRMDNDMHSVIVLKVESDGFVIAEGNYNSSIHWGRKVSRQEHIDYLYTRYEGK